jgi:L-serine dehydratase
MARDLMGGELAKVLVQFDPDGSLAQTHATQGSDMGLFGGLLGWDATDERLIESAAAIQEAGISISIEITPFEALHPNTYRLTLSNSAEEHQIIATSTGGGMIEITEIDGAQVSMLGDYYETLIFDTTADKEAIDFLIGKVEADEIALREGPETTFIQIKGQGFLDEETVSELYSAYGASAVRRIAPVLPVLSRKDIQVPFITCEEMLLYNQDKHLELWELAVRYESARGALSEDAVIEKMRDIVILMKDSIRRGIAGTKYADRILGHQSGSFLAQLQADRLLDAGLLNRMILYVTAMMEVKSAMGVIVAAPTAGSCGVLPGACLGAADGMDLPEDDTVRAMLAAGMIGVFIAAHSTFAAEVCGCQAECGAGSGMAAAALVTLAAGTTRQAVDATSMALQNIFGLVCDPVANRVEVPCLGKNVLAAGNALSCANMALAGFDPVIPLDEVIEAMDAVGKSLPYELRCTALGGLSITPTSKEIESRLRKQAGDG